MSETFTYTSRFDLPAETVFNWHLRPGALARLTPPWQSVQILSQRGGIADGGEVTLRMPLGPLSIRWVARHRDFVPGRQFADEQVKGPFAAWLHTHRVEPDGPNACYLIDRIDYRLPGGPIGRWLGASHVQTMLTAAFAYRHTVTRADLMNLPNTNDTLTVAVTGASGLIGQALIARLTTAGHTVKRVVRRRETGADEIGWLPDERWIDQTGLTEVDAVVHLAGESVMGRWSDAKKQRIRDSRVAGTRLLAETLAAMDEADRPGTLISASAVGYYGDGGDDWLTEQSPPGGGFLAEVAAAWEDAAEPAVTAGVRVAHPRFGAVMSPQGGALQQMLPLFRMGVGGPIGRGKQWLPWVAIDDAVEAIHHALGDSSLVGPFNVTAPAPLTSAQFAKALGRVLGRPAFMPAPATMLRAMMGEMADEVLLASQRVYPKRLLDHGFEFRYPELEPALRHLLGKRESVAR